MDSRPIIIIGSGLAGYTVAREFRKLDKETPLVVVTADAGDFYSKPMLSNALAAGKQPDAIPTANAEQMAAQLNATVLTRRKVGAIDAEAYTVQIGEDVLPYRSLVLALGAQPIDPGLGGNAATDVMHVNDLDDYKRFRAAIAGRKRVAILGGGLIGCEFANDLATAGYGVTLVHPARWPLDRLVPEAVGQQLRSALERAGVTWRSGVKASAVDHDGAGYRVTLSDGSTVESDAVLSAIGLAPRTELAKAAGLRVNRGIVVDRALRASHPDIFALGDCAEVEGLVLPFVLPLMNAARALAKTLAGQETALVYPAMPVVVKTPACPVVVCPPPAGVEGSWSVEELEAGLVACFNDPVGQLCGFALTAGGVARKNALVQQLPSVLK
jgi:rubredoxin-NAD+ reductase